MAKHTLKVVTGIVLDDQQTISLAELCHSCLLSAEQIMGMVEHGIIQPLAPVANNARWQFGNSSVTRIQTAMRLQRDLGVNLAGAALALELLDEIKTLRQLTAALQRQTDVFDY